MNFAGLRAIEVTEDKIALSLRGIDNLTKVQRVYLDKDNVRYGVAVYFAEPSTELQGKVKALLDTFHLIQ